MTQLSEIAEIFAARGRFEQIEKEVEALKSGGGSGTSGGMSDDWKASVDRQLGQLHLDVRALLNRGVAAVVALAVMVGGLYLYFNTKFESVNARIGALEVQQGKSDAIVNGKLDRLLDRQQTGVDNTTGVGNATGVQGH